MKNETVKNVEIMNNLNDFLYSKENSLEVLGSFSELQMNEYINVISVLQNTSIDNLYGLTKEQTYLVRNHIGVYTNKLNNNLLSKKLNCSYEAVCKELRNSSAIINHLITRGYSDPYKALSSGQITKKDILNTKIVDLIEMDTKMYNAFIRKGITTLRETLSLSYEKLTSLRNIGKVSIIKYAKYMHSFGFDVDVPFSIDELSIVEEDKNVITLKELEKLEMLIRVLKENMIKSNTDSIDINRLTLK